ncbi:MAG TPA: sulfur carrier protein ThiS [Lautropia sp.]|nr:sulfur carrier protein ThiS [Lautropia sp.]
MDIVLNGKQHPLEGPMNVAELIDALGFAGKRIAVERNAEIVPRSQHASTALAQGDRVEIVVAVGGG